MTAIWTPGPVTAGMHAAFRATIVLDRPATIALHTLGADFFSLHVDGVWTLDGPERFHVDHPRFRATPLDLAAGRHVIAVHACHTGGDTRMLRNTPPFIAVTAQVDGRELPLPWRCQTLPAFAARRRINPQVGWSEWCDTRQMPDDWQAAGFDDGGWAEPVAVEPKIGAPKREPCPPVRTDPAHPQLLAEGRLAEVFGYAHDDPPLRFLFRDLDESRFPAQGRWWRFDLGRIRLGRPRITLDLAPGAVVELGYSDRLDHGRVAPVISLSSGTSCNLDHYEARGGEQVFAPLEPRGCRFLEVHVIGAGRLVAAGWDERGWFPPAIGTFSCGDPLLERIWQVGAETVRACAEDALIDTPLRERGQWTGDVVPAMEVAAVCWNDLSLVRRALVQAAEDAAGNGLVAGLCPANSLAITTYALQWLSGCVRYVELTGEGDLLTELLPAAERQLAAFAAAEGPDGINDSLGWGFVDWSYVRPPGPCDPAIDVFLARARSAMGRWYRLIGRDGSSMDEAAERGRVRLRRNLPGKGYHLTALGLADGLLPDPAGAIAELHRHLRSCFPHDATAPRLADPAAAQPRLITPYFAHWSLPGLIAHGDMDFVLDEYRRAWGWALDQGLTTWPEVFDLRWSHCHAWSGCPTWQLSRGLLGLHPRQDLGPGHCAVAVATNRLPGAAGRVPFAGGHCDIAWERRDGAIDYRLTPSVEITVGARVIGAGETVRMRLPG